jgi:curved DNA-binding protein CbpA
MIDYYKILNVRRNATAAEIKSAYRRLARERHPDVNPNSTQAARDFALLALAYRTLSDAHERVLYDERWQRVNSSASILSSDNIHAQRMRRMAAQAHWDRAVDRVLEAERRETFEFSRAVFTTVTLFLSTFMVAVLKPRFWQNFDGYIGRAVLIALSVIGLWHLFSRLREYFARYTYKPKPIQDSIMREDEETTKPFTRLTAYSFLVIGYLISIALGLFVGMHFYYIVSDLAFYFDRHVRPDLLFYPPIAVLIVDTMHSFAEKMD